MTDTRTPGPVNKDAAHSRPRQHILPAALIGQFSNGEQKRFRNRRVYVRRRAGGPLISRPANRLAWQAEYYGSDTPAVGRLNVDKVWSGTESGLRKGIGALQGAKDVGSLPLRLWLWVLVPFVASLFARGIDFEAQFDERMRRLLSETRYDELFPTGDRRQANTNQARLIEVVRLLAPIMRASWRIMHNPTPTPLVLNDRGFALYHLSPTEPFYGLPLTPNLMLLLRAGLPAPRADFEAAEITGMEHHVMSLQDVESANRGTFAFAIREVYGPTGECLEALGEPPPAQAFPYPQLIGADALIEAGFDLRFHEADWFAATGKFRAKQNYLPRDPGLPVLIRMDLPMLPAQAYGLAQRTLELAEVSLHDGHGEEALGHCAIAAERDREATSEWLRERLSSIRFGRKRGKTLQTVVQESTVLLESAGTTAYEACAAAMRLALINAGQGRHMETRRLLERAALTGKDFARARIRGALLMEASGDSEGAVEALESAVEGPYFGDAAYHLGELLVHQDSVQSERWFRAAIDSDDRDFAPRALFRLATRLRERGDRSGAIECYVRAQSTDHPHSAGAAAYNYGVYLMEAGESEAAVMRWRRGFAGTDAYWKAHCGNVLGGYLFSVGRFAEARPFLEFAAASRLPEIKDAAALNLGVVLSIAAEDEPAQYWLEQVVAEASGDLPLRARLTLSDIAHRQGLMEVSIGHLALIAGGDLPELAAQALLRWGRRLGGEANAIEAARHFQRAVELAQPGPSEAAALELAMFVRDDGDLRRALALSNLAASGPDAAGGGKAANLAAICSLELGEVEEAIRWFRQAAQSTDHRQSVIGAANLGGVLVDIGQPEEGVAVLRQAKGGGGPGAILAGTNLADYWSKQGQAPRAEREYRWAMSAEAGRYRSQASLSYAKFLSSLGRISEARRVLDGAATSAGPRQRHQLETAAEELRDASEGVAIVILRESTSYIEDEDEKPSRVVGEGEGEARL
jgi:tetratricopeptide (TPR) repeat protein